MRHLRKQQLLLTRRLYKNFKIMKLEFFKKLCCPIDKSDLSLSVFVKDPEGAVIEGLMSCPACKRYYPIVYGIPIMTPDEYREKALEEPILQKWGLKAAEQSPAFLLEAKA